MDNKTAFNEVKYSCSLILLFNSPLLVSGYSTDVFGMLIIISVTTILAVVVGNLMIEVSRLNPGK